MFRRQFQLDRLLPPLLKLGRVEEAIGCYQQALQLRPDYTNARNNLRIALQLVQKGKGDAGEDPR